MWIKLVKTWERSPTPMVDHQWAPENLGEFHGSMLNISGKVGVSTNGVHLTSSFVCVILFPLQQGGAPFSSQIHFGDKNLLSHKNLHRRLWLSQPSRKYAIHVVGGIEYPLETMGNHRKMWGNSGIYIYTGWWLSLPLWKIWVSESQLGWWHSQYDGKVIKFHGSKPPIR